MDESTQVAVDQPLVDLRPSAGLAPQGPLDKIEVLGARQHNLKNLSLTLPKRQLVVFTGPSGSGKSSLAFDTLFAEGQRRYVESLSAYARQFLGQMDKPDFDAVRGLSPTISIEQKSAGTNPRSTVGTITEIYDHLRILYARVGQQRCTECGSPVGKVPLEEIVERVLALPEGSRLMLLAPKARNRKGEYRELFENLLKEGFTRVLVDGEVMELFEGMKLKKSKRHNIDVIVDRVVVRANAQRRLADSVALALRIGEGSCQVQIVGGKTLSFSQNMSCCGISYPELSHQSFSFNSPLGMCPDCNGLGELRTMDEQKIVPDKNLSLAQGAVAPWGKPGKPSPKTTSKSKERDGTWTWEIVNAVCEAHGIDLETPWKSLSAKSRKVLMHGSDKEVEVHWTRKRSSGTWKVKFEGALNTLMRRYRETSSSRAREHYAQYLSTAPCKGCDGARLRPESLAVFVGERNISEVSQMSTAQALEWVEGLELQGTAEIIGRDLIKEIAARLRFLLGVGLDYLSLDRPGPTLSGGEAQRIRLASQLGSELSGVLYILDEPSIGLHQRDNRRLLATLTRLRELGNSVIVVEHDSETMLASDWVVDFGPGAGRHGGDVVFSGPPEALIASEGSVTGDYLSGRRQIEVPKERREGSGQAIRVVGAKANNLRNVSVDFPLGCFVCVTGVSGAGKSTLIHDILYPAASKTLYKQSLAVVGQHERIEGLELINKVIEIDQKPIGRTPRSNPATYVKLFDHIRDVFARLPDSRIYGYTKSRFSFNVKGGRCEACQGAGRKKMEMHFLADVYVPCEVCQGKRFNEATLKVRYKGLSIADVLALPVSDAMEVLGAHPKIARILQTLLDVGLGYIQLGQASNTLSGGEAQRIKLSRELAKIATGDTLYILDEPSTGLHFDDIQKLLKVIGRLVDAGNTVVMIEHNLDIIKTADWVIDMGPEGGVGGGKVVAQGTPEKVARSKRSHTGRFLAEILS